MSSDRTLDFVEFIGISGQRRAWLTSSWLLALFVTTRVQRSAGRSGSKRLQRSNSTNLHRLQKEPVRVLLASLMWLDDRKWWPYVPIFAGVVGPAELRLGWWRWLAAGVTAHIIATYTGQSFLRWSIKKGRAPRRLVNARDVGASYFILGVAGVLSGYMRRPKRRGWQAAGVAALTVNAVLRPTFTEVGHSAAFVVGLASVPLAPNRDLLPYPSREVIEAANQARAFGGLG